MSLVEPLESAAASPGYSRARRRLGAAAVGTTVVVAATLLIVDPRLWVGASDGALLTDVGQLVGILLFHAALLLPFEWMGGVVLPERYGHAHLSRGAWWRRWARGWAVQTAIIVAFSLAWMWTFRVLGFGAAVLVAVVSTRLLLGVQGAVARLAGLRTVPTDSEQRAQLATHAGVDPRQVVLVDTAQDAFVGGWVGAPGHEQLWLPRHWLERLDGRQLRVQMLRRQGARVTGMRMLGAWGAWLWTAGGLVVSVWASGGDLATPAGLWMIWLCFTLWSFLGVLLLPSVSRQGVYSVDAWALAHGATGPGIQAVLRKLDALQGDETERTPTTETIFHPVPALAGRLESLERAPALTVRPWRIARTALFLGWLGGGGLGRAVHCNVGRPDLWVLLPGD